MSANPTSSTWLTTDLNEQSLYFASQNVQFRAELDDQSLRHCAPVSTAVVDNLFKQAHQANITEPILFGLIPFNALEPASFTIPAVYQRAAVPETAPQSSAGQQRPTIDRKSVV